MEVDTQEVLYGGAAGGGKSDALLMAALQFVEVPGYAAILFRKTYADLALPGALMDRAASILTDTGAKWNGQEKVWTFPSGATLSFGYLDGENDRYRYQSSEFQYIAFDELTQFKERDYLYLFSRLRRTTDNQIPLRMRAGTNPGGVGHGWVKRRFLKGWDGAGRPSTYRKTADRVFIGAKLEDNPYLDISTYEKSLEELDSQTRRQLRAGDWIDFLGNHYRPDLWPRYIDTGDAYRITVGFDRWKHIRKEECSRLIALDWAMGKPKKDTPVGSPEILTGDCTAFVVADMADDPELDGTLFILGAVNERIPLAENAPRLAELCRRFQPLVVAADNDNLSETMALECRRYNDIPTIKPMQIGGRNKITRSQAAIVRAERGKMYLPENTNPWVEMLCDQLASFTGVDGEPDDLADAVAILGRLADEFQPGEDYGDEVEPELGSPGYVSGW
jgi:hypothetical protein